jgi:hypothetical protein
MKLSPKVFESQESFDRFISYCKSVMRIASQTGNKALRQQHAQALVRAKVRRNRIGAYNER